jgi:hypothetical protein
MTTETSLASTMVHLGRVWLAAPNWAQRMHRSHDWLPALFTRPDPPHVGTTREQARRNGGIVIWGNFLLAIKTCIFLLVTQKIEFSF